MHAKAPVRLDREGDVAVIVIDNPPVNAASHAVRAGLLAVIEAVSTDPEFATAVLIGSGKCFIAGSDISEFGQSIELPDLPMVIAAVEASAKPFVAALHGAALGGGFELALGCDARIATADAVVGLPEVTLGVIPGAGGTQRLPRVVGIAKAIELICAGTRLGAPEALALGLVDALATDDLRAAAIAHARSLSSKARISDRPVPDGAPGAAEAATQAALRKARGRATVRLAIDTIELAGRLPFADGQKQERQTFQLLRMGEEAAALRHLFFAERAAQKFDAGDVQVPAIETVGIAGGGTMGSGIVAAFAAAGVKVSLFDASAEALERARVNVGAALGSLGKSGTVQFVATLDGIAAADLVIEAVFEDFAIKAGLLRDIDRLAPPKTLIASNTSYLDLDALAAETARPEQVLGLHFFAPAQRMKLLEIVVGARTSAGVTAAALALAKRLGKQPILAGVGDGFVGNRIFAKYRQQAEFMLEEGALPEQVDAAAEALGFAMGPFAVADLSGLDIAWRNRQRQAPDRDRRVRYVCLPDLLCEAGRLGRKTGAGWYDYPAGAGRGVPSPVVAALIAENQLVSAAGTALDKDAIGRRLLGAAVNEAALVLAEGVARAAGDIDVAFVNGYGFSRFKGGPLFQAARLDAAAREAMIEAVAKASGFGFRKGNVEDMLAGMVSQGGRT